VKKITSFLFAVFTISCLNTFSQSVATYDVSLTTIWNNDHTSVPDGAHWSSLVGATHNTIDKFLSLGTNATLGIKNVAESGNSVEFNNEVNAAISLNEANQLIDAGSIETAIGTFSINNLSVSENYPLITLISMVAPSPDWFIAINSLNLRSGNNSINNGWKDTFTLDVFAYDAGTDDGTNYDSPNSANTPVGIFMISGAPINGKKMGTITFTYNSSTLNLAQHNAIEQIKIYPNPTDGNIKIANIQNANLISIEVYNILGSLIKQIPIEKSNNILGVNLSNLAKGMYLLKLNAFGKLSKTEKLIVD
jgi:hypothetical protein